MNNYKSFSQKTYEEIVDNIKNDQGNSFISIDENTKPTDKIIALKDIHANTDLNTTFASEILKDYRSPYDSTVVKLLKEKGYSIVGHTNLDQFAMGSTNRSSFFGAVKHPTMDGYVPGGSSGGSAYAVKKGLVPVATGTDTGGSIRQPASFTGIYGMKPTYGLISRYGTFSFSSSFDTIGVMSNTIEDNISTLKDLAQNDNNDQTNFVPEGYDPSSKLDQPLKGKKIGVFRYWINQEGVDEEIRDAVLSYLEDLKKEGCEIVDIDIPLTMYSFELYVALAYAEVSSNLNRYDGIRFGTKALEDSINPFKSARRTFGSEVKKRMIIGTYMINSKNSKTFFGHAQRIRKQISNEFDQAFTEVDVIVAPVTPQVGIKMDEKTNLRDNYLSDKFAIPANLTGVPAMSVPYKKAKNGHPIGIQLYAQRYNEADIYQVAKQMEVYND